VTILAERSACMPIDLPAVLVFVAVTTLTPGPNTILGASIGALHGYRRAVPFMLGVATGFLVIMLLCATLSSLLTGALPAVMPVLRWLGAAYIVYLAVGVYRGSGGLLAETTAGPPLSFAKGCALQFVNPKVMVFGMTVYAAFLAPALDQLWVVAGSAPLLALVAFLTVSAWAAAGHGIRRWVRTPRRARLVGAVLALALVWTAVDLAGLLPG
jgi:cysteine/O-acetylserine efflux protein